MQDFAKMFRMDLHTLVVVIVSGFLDLSLSSKHERLGKLECTAGQSVCPDFSHCIPSNYFCDGRKDCEDGSDERRTMCFYRNFTCDDNTQIRSWLRCNGRKECPDGSDEENCDKRTTSSKLTSLLFPSTFTLPLETITETETYPSTESSTTIIFSDEDEATTTTELNNNSKLFDFNVQDHLPAGHLSSKKELNSPEFLKPFTLWLAIVIGSLAGLALVTIVIVRVSVFVKKPRSKSITSSESNQVPMALQEEYFSVIFTIPLSKLPTDLFIIPAHDQ